MRLGDFLSAARPIPHKPIKFKAIGKDPSGNVATTDVDAVFVFVDEHERQRARVEAMEALKKEYKDAEPPPAVVSDEIAYHFLFRALRDAQDERITLAESVRALKNALVAKEAARLDEEYNAWIDLEYPDSVTAEEFEKMKQEAKSLFFADLLTAYGFSAIRKALPSLARAYGK